MAEFLEDMQDENDCGFKRNDIPISFMGETNNFIYVKIAKAENCILQDADECNLDHPKIPNKPHLLRCGKTQEFFDLER